MSVTIHPDVIAQHLTAIRKEIHTEYTAVAEVDPYRCGIIDGRLEALLQLQLISIETYLELMALGEYSPCRSAKIRALDFQ